MPVNRGRWRRPRLRDWVLYISISLAIATAGVVLARTGLTHDAFIRWGGLAFNTAVLFAYFVADSRDLWGRRGFWALTCGLLVTHTSAFCLVLEHVPEWRLPWFMVMCLEIPVFMFLRDRGSGSQSRLRSK
jgi:peptidoglycan/LPS O-acetylase OafA/YrhL